MRLYVTEFGTDPIHDDLVDDRLVVVNASGPSCKKNFDAIINDVIASNVTSRVLATYGPTDSRKTLKSWVYPFDMDESMCISSVPNRWLEEKLFMTGSATKCNIAMDAKGVTAVMLVRVTEDENEAARDETEDAARSERAGAVDGRVVDEGDDSRKENREIEKSADSVKKTDARKRKRRSVRVQSDDAAPDDDAALPAPLPETAAARDITSIPSLETVTAVVTAALENAAVRDTSLLSMARDTFDLEHGIASMYRALVDGETQQTQQLLFGGGKMQSRKTVSIAVFFMVAHLLKTVVISVNHLVKGSQNMQKNMEGDASMSEDARWGYMVAIRNADPVNFGGFKYTVLNTRSSFMNGAELDDIIATQQGVISIANTSAQMIAVADILRHRMQFRRHAVVMDEADALDRKDGTQLSHCQRKMFGAKMPLTTFFVTGTLFPKLAEVMESGRGEHLSARNFVFTNTTDDYSDFDIIRPLTDPDTGHDVFLEHKELDKDELFYNRKVEMMLDDFVNTPKGLMPNMVTSRVNVDGHMRAVADNIMNMTRYRNKMATIVSSGGNTIHIRFNSDDAKWYSFPKSSIENGIMEVEFFMGCDFPIMVMTYATSFRAVSIRSMLRVVTHHIIFVGKGYNMEAITQGMARGCGYTKAQLVANGVDRVTVLTIHEDYDTAIAYDRLFDELRANIDRGMTLGEAWTAEYTSFANAFERSSRKMGQRGEDARPQLRFKKRTRRDAEQMAGLQYQMQSVREGEDEDEELSESDANDGDSDGDDGEYEGPRTLAKLFNRTDSHYIDRNAFHVELPDDYQFPEGYVLDERIDEEDDNERDVYVERIFSLERMEASRDPFVFMQLMYFKGEEMPTSQAALNRLLSEYRAHDRVKIAFGVRRAHQDALDVLGDGAMGPGSRYSAEEVDAWMHDTGLQKTWLTTCSAYDFTNEFTDVLPLMHEEGGDYVVNDFFRPPYEGVVHYVYRSSRMPQGASSLFDEVYAALGDAWVERAYVVDSLCKSRSEHVRAPVRGRLSALVKRWGASTPDAGQRGIAFRKNGKGSTFYLRKT